ncbi:MAG TPA: ABC transporter substrate-binding protein [bacterium]|nr:ABC transporter substrate-binding protein [bacterium]
MKQRLCLVVCTMLVVLVAVPFQQTAGAAAPMDLVFWGGWTGPDGDVMHQMVDQFNKEHPDIRVTLTTLQWTPLFDKLLTSVRAGQPPDLMGMHSQDIAQFASLGILEPMGDMVKAAGFKASDFMDVAWKGTFSQNTQYAIPLDMHMHAVYVNLDMWKAAGLPANKLPTTGTDFVAAAKKLTIDGAGRHPDDPAFDPKTIKQYGVGMMNNHHGFYMWYALLAQQGDPFLAPDFSRTVFSDAKANAAWQWLQDLVFKDHVVPVGETNPYQDFVTKHVAMLIDGPWEIPGLNKVSGLRWDTTTFPRVFAAPAAWGSGHLLTIPKQSNKAREQAALTLATWIVQHSQDWGMSGNLPALLSARTSAAFRALPGRRGFLEEQAYEIMLPDVRPSAQLYSAAAPSPIVVAAQSVLVKGQPVAGVTQELRARINAILAAP